ncbi:hypothetical protein Tco_1399056, partial [Tanacetum coccineum]
VFELGSLGILLLTSLRPRAWLANNNQSASATTDHSVPFIMENRHDLRLTSLAFFTSAGSVPPMSTCLLKCAKLIDAILLNASAFLFSLLGTCLIENTLKLLVNSIPSGLVSISPALELSVQEDLFVNKIHGSSSSSASSIRVSGESYSGRSTIKYANICPLTDTLGFCRSVYEMLCPPNAGRWLQHSAGQKPLYASKKHLKGNPHRDLTFQSISGSGLPSKNIQVSLEQAAQLVATFFPGRVPSDPETRAHSSGINLLLFKVITPPSTGSFSIPCAVDGTACSFLTPGLLIIPLYGDGDLMTTKLSKLKRSALRLQLLPVVVFAISAILSRH